MSPILPYISRVKPKPKLGGFSCSPWDFMSSFWIEEEDRNEREISTVGTEQELSPEQPIPHQQDPSTADCWGHTIWNSTETSMSTRKYRLSPLHWCILYLHTHHFFYGLHFFFSLHGWAEKMNIWIKREVTAKMTALLMSKMALTY